MAIADLTRPALDVRALRSRFRGALLLPGEDGYAEARRVWNGAIDRRPAIIARCTGTADVQEAVRFARAHDLPVAVRGGGHSVVGHAVQDGAVTVDLSLMKAVTVDPRQRVARAAGGLTWGELDLATQRHGLATPGGTVSHVGIGGSTLAGGFGHLMRRHGLTVDNLRGADLVTADGDLARADAGHDPELLWGLRGGGGNFGIATTLEYDLHPVGPLMVGGLVLWPLEQAHRVLGVLRDLAPAAPDDLGVMLVAHRAPPAPFVPPEHVGRPVLGLVLVWAGDPAACMEAIAPLRAAGTPIADLVRLVPYRALQTLLDAGAPHGTHAHWRSHRLPALSDAVIDRMAGLVEGATSPMSLLHGWVIGGAVSRVAPEATAVGAREPGFELRLVAVWPPGDDPERHRAWVRDGWASLRPHADGRQWASFLADEGEEGVRAAYGERLPRLAALKRRVDPDDVLRHTAHIPPTPGGSR